MTLLNRRRVLAGLITAPLIVRPQSIMRINPLLTTRLMTVTHADRYGEWLFVRASCSRGEYFMSTWVRGGSNAVGDVVGRIVDGKPQVGLGVPPSDAVLTIASHLDDVSYADLLIGRTKDAGQA